MLSNYLTPWMKFQIRKEFDLTYKLSTSSHELTTKIPILHYEKHVNDH
jgi:hypothetical protein